MLSIVVPAYNEARTIETVLRRILALQLPVAFEVIVVDDGSSDGTAGIVARAAAQDARVRLERLTRNSGKGSAIRHAAAAAGGDVLVVQDADLEVDPAELPALLAPILAGTADVVYGSRFAGRPFEWSVSYLANRFLTGLTNVLFSSRLTDMETAHKMMKISVYRGLRLEGRRFEIEPEVTAEILRRGYRIHEVPIRYVRRAHKQGKKIGWRDGIAAMRMLLRCRFLRPIDRSRP